MPKVLRIDKDAEQAVKELLKHLFESGQIGAAVTLQQNKENSNISYALISNVDALEKSCPLFPLMPTNAGQVLTRLTLAAPVPEPVAAVVRPCELRAFVELVKRYQGSLDNFIFISSTCGGVFPLKDAVNGKLSDFLVEYWISLKNGEIPTGTRSACQVCEYFLPFNADFTVSLIGRTNLDKQCSIFVNTEKAELLVEEMKTQIVNETLETDKIATITKKRESNRDRVIVDANLSNLGLDGLVNMFGRCISCHGCSRACPLCYCDLCTFDSREREQDQKTCVKEAARKGAMRIPSDTTFFQLGRLTHVGISCLACGQCEDVCPVDIKLYTLFSNTGRSVQEAFNYIPGKDIADELPLTVFKAEEFEEIED